MSNKLWVYSFGVLMAVGVIFAFIGRESLFEFAAPPQATSTTEREGERTSVLFLGDMMFDRAIRSVAEKEGYPYLFSCISDLLQDEELVVANLEGPITTHKSVSKGSTVGSGENFTFTFDPAVTDALLLANISVVNVGNNHILNFGQDGLKQTREALAKAGMQYFGDPAASSTALVLEGGDLDLALVNYNQFAGPKAEEVLTTIAREHQAGRSVVVYTHWSEEYVPPTTAVRELAHKFIDAGADAVIGSHPHVVLEHEFYRSRPIYYSLGNFIFDQYFNNGVKHGLAVRLTFRGPFSIPEVEELPVELMRDGRTCLTTTSTTTPSTSSSAII